MKKTWKILLFIVSIVVMGVSVIILVLMSVFSMLFNSVLFILMISGLSLPMFGNMIVNMLPQKKSS